jgi:transposase
VHLLVIKQRVYEQAKLAAAAPPDAPGAARPLRQRDVTGAGTLLKMHEEAFRQHGGVPEESLYDRMKTVWVEVDDRGEIRATAPRNLNCSIKFC